MEGGQIVAGVGVRGGSGALQLGLIALGRKLGCAPEHQVFEKMREAALAGFDLVAGTGSDDDEQRHDVRVVGWNCDQAEAVGQIFLNVRIRKNFSGRSRRSRSEKKAHGKQSAFPQLHLVFSVAHFFSWATSVSVLRNTRKLWPPKRGWTGGFLHFLAPRTAALALFEQSGAKRVASTPPPGCVFLPFPGGAGQRPLRFSAPAPMQAGQITFHGLARVALRAASVLQSRSLKGAGIGSRPDGKWRRQPELQARGSQPPIRAMRSRVVAGGFTGSVVFRC